MDRSWFINELQRTEVSQADLARHLGLAPSAVSRMLNGERQMRLREAVGIAELLGVDHEVVLRRATAQGHSDPAVAARRRGRPLATRHFERGSAARPSPAIPIRGGGHILGGRRGPLEAEPVGHTACPPNLNGVRGAYALYMDGDYMAPRYEPGWLLYINPHKPPIPGRDAAVYKKGGAVLIRQFVGWQNGALIFRQLNPEELLRVPPEEVTALHMIVGVDQEG